MEQTGTRGARPHWEGNQQRRFGPKSRSRDSLIGADHSTNCRAPISQNRRHRSKHSSTTARRGVRRVAEGSPSTRPRPCRRGSGLSARVRSSSPGIRRRPSTRGNSTGYAVRMLPPWLVPAGIALLYAALIAVWRWLLRRWGLAGPTAPPRRLLGRSEYLARRSLRALLAFDFLLVIPMGLPAAVALLSVAVADPRELEPEMIAAVLVFLATFLLPVPALRRSILRMEQQRLGGQVVEADPPPNTSGLQRSTSTCAPTRGGRSWPRASSSAGASPRG